MLVIGAPVFYILVCKNIVPLKAPVSDLAGFWSIEKKGMGKYSREQ